MKSKKKVWRVVLLVVSLLLCITAFSLGACTTSASADTGEVTQVPETFGSRVQKWFEDNFLQFIGSSTFGVVVANIVTLIVDHKSSKKNAKQTLATLVENTRSNGEVVSTVNLLIESHNSIVDRLNTIDERDAEHAALVNQMIIMSKAILEILATVYANNKNIPQGVKDLVSLKYVGALKQIEPVAELQQVVSTTEGE